jgi:hypothetical protein
MLDEATMRKPLEQVLVSAFEILQENTERTHDLLAANAKLSEGLATALMNVQVEHSDYKMLLHEVIALADTDNDLSGFPWRSLLSKIGEVVHREKPR